MISPLHFYIKHRDILSFLDEQWKQRKLFRWTSSHTPEKYSHLHGSPHDTNYFFALWIVDCICWKLWQVYKEHAFEWVRLCRMHIYFMHRRYQTGIFLSFISKKIEWRIVFTAELKLYRNNPTIIVGNDNKRSPNRECSRSIWYVFVKCWTKNKTCAEAV